MNGEHASGELVARYAAGDPGIPADRLWAVEAHLEGCGVCRGRLADAAAPEVGALTAAVWAGLEPELTGRPGTVRRRGVVATWATPSMVAWLLMAVLVTASALLLDLMLPARAVPSAVLLVAPVVPVLGVAAAWSRVTDPAHELVASTPRAGLHLVLRRTVAVLVVVLPVLLVGGGLVGASPALWLLPCLAATAATLALGGLMGVRRAAAVIAALWAALVVGPTLLLGGAPVVMTASAATPVWWAVLGTAVVVVLAGSGARTRLGDL